VRSLDLSGCSLPSFPPSHLPSLAKLEILVLANNRLREWPLPPGPMCPPLRSLDVSRNPMAAVPADAISGCLATLTHLNLSGGGHKDMGLFFAECSPARRAATLADSSLATLSAPAECSPAM